MTLSGVLRNGPLRPSGRDGSQDRGSEQHPSHDLAYDTRLAQPGEKLTQTPSSPQEDREHHQQVKDVVARGGEEGFGHELNRTLCRRVRTIEISPRKRAGAKH